MNPQPLSDSGDDFDQTIKFKVPGSGMTVFNRYQLKRILGRGGMGIVWLANDLKLERPVALKFLPSLVGLDPAAVKELKTETRRGLELSHPNIVRIYDFVDDEDSAAIAMEFVDGKTLSELRDTTEHGVFTAEQIGKWLPGVCMALDYAHVQRKVIHRDMKPANIMVMAGGEMAKVADFGIARSISDTMRFSMSQMGVSGTLPYMSPQQSMGERPTATDDIYSLGATIYELFTGKPPFYRGDISSQVASIVPPSMTARREELGVKATEVIPREWETAIAACLNKDPILRPRSASKLLEMLRLGNASGIIERKTGSQSGTATAPGKVPRAAYAVMAAAAVVTLWAVFFQSAPTSDPAPTPASSVAFVTKLEETPNEIPPRAVVVEPVPAPVSGVPPKAIAVEAPPAQPMPVEPAPVVNASSPAMPLAMEQPPVSAAVPMVASPVPQTLPPFGGVEPGMGGLQAAPQTPLLPQPARVDPPEGYWPIAELYPHFPQNVFSENGRRRLLYEVQGVLRARSLYSSTQDGKEGKGTHNAIVLFQAKNGLAPNGLLDGPTLAAMSLTEYPDDLEWLPPVSVSSGKKSSGGGGKEEPNALQRAGKSLGRFFRGE